jgi:hypothetical protein
MRGQEDVLPSVLSNWDYGTNIPISRQLEVDTAGILADCGISPADRIGVDAIWTMPGTPFRGVLFADEILTSDGSRVVHVQGVLLGVQIAGTVRIETSIILLAGRQREPITVWRPGSILWKDNVDVAVEGGAPRFPIEVVDFRMSGLPENAVWHLEWNSYDLEQPLLGSLRLLINSNHPRVVDAVSSREDETSRIIRSAIYFDVARSLVRGALSNDEFVANPDVFTSGSVGNALAGLLNTLFPNDAPATLKSALQQRTEYFDSLLQAKLRLFDQ